MKADCICSTDSRKEDDFNKFATVLQEIVDLKKEIVAVTHAHLGAPATCKP
jgi:Zn-dependent M32 family carboxypeptidase